MNEGIHLDLDTWNNVYGPLLMLPVMDYNLVEAGAWCVGICRCVSPWPCDGESGCMEGGPCFTANIIKETGRGEASPAILI